MANEEIKVPTTSYQKSTDKVKNFIKDNLSKFMLVAIVLTYVAQGCFQLVQKDWDFSAFIGRMGASLIVGLAIYNSMRMSGLQDGRKHPDFMASYKLYAQQKERVSKTKQYKLSAFCLYKNSQSLEEAKQTLLEEYGIQYTLWKKGAYEETTALYNSLDKEQKKALYYVSKGRIKINVITTRSLLSDSPKLSKKALKQGCTIRDEKDYTRDNMLKDTFMMILWSAVFSGYISLPILNGETLASVLWNTWQVICWLAGGITKYQDAKDFMINEYRQTHLVEKVEILGEFLSIMEYNEQMLDKYDFIGHEIEKLEQSEEKENGKEKSNKCNP